MQPVSEDVAQPEDEQASALGRAITGTTIGMFVPVAAMWVVGDLFVFPLALAIGSIAGDAKITPLLIVLVWTLSAGLMFLRPVEEVVGNFFYGLRRPTGAEMERLSGAWNYVCAAAGVDSSKYILRVQEIGEINALAGGGHVVAVTRLGLTLEEEELRAVLGHELAHHLDLHPVPLMLSAWYQIPVRIANLLMGIIERVAVVLSKFDGVFQIVALVLLVPIWILRLYIGVIIWASNLVAAIFGRFAEYAADRRATDLGFGRGLISVLEVFIDMGHDEAHAKSGLVARAFSVHPQAHKRIRAIERRIAENATLVAAPAAAALPGVVDN